MYVYFSFLFKVCNSHSFYPWLYFICIFSGDEAKNDPRWHFTMCNILIHLINCMNFQAGLDRNQLCSITPFRFSWLMVAQTYSVSQNTYCNYLEQQKHWCWGVSDYICFNICFPLDSAGKEIWIVQYVGLIMSVCCFGNQIGRSRRAVDDCVQMSKTSCWNDISIDCNLGV